MIPEFAAFTPELPAHILIRHSKRAKRLALRLDQKERVFHLVIPKGVSMRRAVRFAEEQEFWMQDKLKELLPRITLDHGVRVPILGQEKTIHVSQEKFRPSVAIEGDQILVSKNAADSSGRIVRHLKKFIKTELEILSKAKAAQIGKTVKSVSIRDPKTRWGSCSASGALSYSWRIVFAPYEALDYLVAHEVAHLRHLDHSKAFWALCEDLSEDFKAGHGWMKQHAHELRRYG